MYATLLIDLFKFLAPFLRNAELTKPAQLLYKVIHLGRVAPTSFMISVQLNLDQKLNQVHAELRCTKLNSDQLIPFS